MTKSYHISRITLAMIWLYHGLVPKLLFASRQEIEMNEKLLPFLTEKQALWGSGIAEVLLALAYIIFYRSKWLNFPMITFATLATLSLIFTHSHFFTLAFNPFSINLAVVSLAWINVSEFNKGKTYE